MPKRIVDGEGIWRSDKLLRVDEKYRAEYANLIPLALANGVFEVNPKRIWSIVYSHNRPSVSSKIVVEILEQFNKSGLLFIWSEAFDKKMYGYWVGIEKPGRLPGPSRRGSNEKIGPEPPSDLLDQYKLATVAESTDSNGFQNLLGLGVGFGLGMGIGLGSDTEESMSFKSNITDKAREILGTRISPQDSKWEELRSVARVYGQKATEAAFEDWANSVRGDVITYPLSKFADVADGLLRGITTVKQNPAAAELINDLVYLSDDQVVFDTKQSLVISKLLDDWSPSAIKEAFRTFYGQIEGDDFQIKHAARKFTEVAPQLLATQKRRQDDARKQEELTVRIMNEQREQAEKEIAAAQKQQNEVDSLIEDTLGG